MFRAQAGAFFALRHLQFERFVKFAQLGGLPKFGAVIPGKELLQSANQLMELLDMDLREKNSCAAGAKILSL